MKKRYKSLLPKKKEDAFTYRAASEEGHLDFFFHGKPIFKLPIFIDRKSAKQFIDRMNAVSSKDLMTTGNNIIKVFVAYCDRYKEEKEQEAANARSNSKRKTNPRTRKTVSGDTARSDRH